ncbi:sodium-coupled monocarboxylate transporter 2-like isoform X1 [Zophobas morio]|uniref:sodium-coupled monocarboxylate transporter 2-like isoform X1 n=1 Tax=Zophobas morio TaxID=2755281 RepID=UPI003082F2A9
MLTVFDYLILCAMLLISVAIGIYFGCFGTKQATTKEYLHGGKKMGVIAVGVSVGVSHFSGVTMMAIPADVYKFGAYLLFINLAAILVGLLSVYVYLPVFFQLQISSSYEYLAKRFDNRTKQLAVYLYLFSEIIFFPLLAYIPALAFSATSGLSVNLTAFVVCALCIFYTTIGGLKTVVWTDFFQFIVIMVSVIINCYLGLEKSGGFMSIWDTALSGQRLINITDFNVDLTRQDSFWTMTVGYTITLASTIVVHQTGVQKYLSVSKFRHCIWSVVYSTFCKCAVSTLCVFIGLEIYAKYSDCDPLISNKIKKYDHILPYFLTEVAGQTPGILGLFVASIFSAALSSMSSLLNSIAGIIYNDLIKKRLKKEYSELTQSNILKVLIILCGVAGTCLVFLIQHLGPLLALNVALRGPINGPLLGMFTLGMLFPKSNSEGAFYGGLISLISVSALMIITKYYELRQVLVHPTKPFSVDSCENVFKNSSTNSILARVTNFTTTTTTYQEVPFLFKLSFHYYTLLGAILTILIGVLISCMSSKSQNLVDEDLISPICQKFLSKKRHRKYDEFHEKDSRKHLIEVNSEKNTTLNAV